MSKQPPKLNHEIIRERALDRILFILEIALVITLIALCGVIITSL